MHELVKLPFFPPVMPASFGGEGDDDEGKSPVRTQMVGEAPGEDLGYDPATIPTEKIPDSDEEDDDDDDS